MLQGLDIVTFANDWSADPTSKHHIMKRFAERNRVLWVEAAGMRTPNLKRAGDLQRLVTKARSFTRRARPVLPNMHAYSPPTIPLPGSRLASAANAALYRASIGRELRSLGMRPDPLLWIYGPHVAPWIRGMRRSFLLYHCVDRWSAFQGYDPEIMVAGEAEICRAADLVIASAEDLVERCRQHTSNVHYVPHGVDHAHFATALDEGDLPAELAAIPGPRIGFFGLIHEWVDIDLIGRLADRLPYNFVLIGATDQDLGPLTARANVFHLGRKPYAQLPGYSRGFAAAIVPFRTSELTASVNPIKLREYAAAGLPVVSTGLPEVRRCGDIADCAEGDDEWVAALERSVARGLDPEERRRQSARVLSEDWSTVVTRISGLIRASTRRSAVA
jgi:glycosyltransferase involved in cell wall biosynthesis